MLNEWTRERAIPPSRGVAIPPTESEGPFEDNKDRTEFPLTKGEAYGAETQPLAKELKGLIRQACEELDFLKEEVNGPCDKGLQQKESLAPRSEPLYPKA